MSASKSSLRSVAFKQHTCTHCECRFRYPVEIKTPRGTMEPEFARKVHARRVLKTIEVFPCPECGLIQPEMFAGRRARYHDGFTTFSLILLAVPVALFVHQVLNGTHVLSLEWSHRIDHWIPWMTLGTVGVGALSLIAHYWICSWSPNRDLVANQTEALRAIEAGRLEIVEKPPRSYPVTGEFPWTRVSTRQMVILAVIAFSLFAIACAEVLAFANGWFYNAGAMPPVVGPGDTVQVIFPEDLRSLEGLKWGTAKVTVENAEDLGLKESDLSAWTDRDDWGTTIRNDDITTAAKSSVWVKFVLPKEPGLRDRELQLLLSANLKYPKSIGRDQFKDRTKEFQYAIPLQLSDERAGRDYWFAWWGGHALGLLGFVFGMAQLHKLAQGIAKEGNEVEVILPDPHLESLGGDSPWRSLKGSTYPA